MFLQPAPVYCIGDIMKAETYLKQIMIYEQIIEDKLDKAINWRENAVNTSVNYDNTRVKISGVSDKVGNSVAQFVDEESDIVDITYKILLARKSIIDTIEQLPLEQYDLCYKMYVRGMEFEEIKSTYKRVSIQRLKRIHKEALENVQNILDKGDNLD